ncbi:MAG: adenylate/guanylate cyclase domain-containing protein [Spirochaetaceae bacterium]
MSGEQALREGERRFVTVIFADMKGFTALSERMDPEEMDNLMSALFADFEEIIRQYEGTVEKYIGDALVAVFGVPEIHEDDPARAVNAALDFLETTKKRAVTTVDGADGVPGGIGFRIGIHTGLITTGKRGQFDVVTGHAMAVASRLQTAAPMNGILISEETREKCREEFLFSEPQTLEIRGRREGIRAYRIRGKSTQPFAEESPFVDREQEVDQLRKGYLRHSAMPIGGYFIVGDAGIGKTRLATRFLETLREFPEFNTPILRARARKYRRRNFAVVTDLLVDYFGLRGEESRAEAAVRIENMESVDPETARSFVDILFDTDAVQDAGRVFLVLHLLFRLILQQHRDEPYSVVIFIDNAESMDRESRNFFLYVFNEAEDKPFFLLCDREAQEISAESFLSLERMRLGPLSHAASRELFHRLRTGVEDEATLEEALTNAAGNPLFIREYARLAAEHADDSALPTTIQNIFLASVQRFRPDQRELLRKLAVFVHSFTVADAEFLQERTGADPTLARGAIEAFERDGILIREDSVCLFKHEVFKQALYNSILNHNKRILHKLIAERMRAFPNPHTGRLLHHLTRAEEWEDVRTLLQDAPDGSFKMEYLTFYDALLDHLGPTEHAARAYLLFRKCTILFNNGRSERADAILKQILTLAATHRIAGAAANAYHILTAYNSKAYSLQKACFCGRKALYYYEQLPDTTGARRNVLKLLSLAELLRNRVDESGAFLGELDELSPAGHAEQVSAYAERHILMGEYGKALDVLGDVIADDSRIPESYRLGQLFLALMAAWFACDFDSVLTVTDRLFREKHRHYGYRSQAIAHAVGARHLLGREDQVTHRLQQAEFEFYQIRNDFDRVDALRTLSEVCLIVGNEEKAESLALEGIAIGLRHSAYFPTFTLLMLLVEVNVRRKDGAAARFFLDEASFLVELDPLLRNRDRILYHYFALLTGFDDAPDEHRARAREHLAEERRNIGNDELFQNLLRQRSFGEIARELEIEHGVP